MSWNRVPSAPKPHVSEGIRSDSGVLKRAGHLGGALEKVLCPGCGVAGLEGIGRSAYGNKGKFGIIGSPGRGSHPDEASR